VAVISCTQKPSFVIEGTIDQEAGTIYLQKFRNKMFFVTDSAQINNGTFRFTGSVDRPDLYGITTNREESFSPYYIFIENSEINVDIKTEDRRSAAITGSAANDLYEQYLAARGPQFKIDSFIEAHPASVVPAYVLYRDYSTSLDAEELQANVDKFDASLGEVSYLRDLREVITAKQLVSIGQPAVDVSGASPGGAELRLSDYRGKVVLLEFWASWCGPCRRENPNLVRVYNQFHDQGFEIFGVSLDNNRESWLKAIESDNLTWPHISDLKFWDSGPAQIYGIRHIPSNVLIDASGVIVGKNLKSEELEEKLGQLLIINHCCPI
jgi:peroxiredoxin